VQAASTSKASVGSGKSFFKVFIVRMN